MKPLLGSRRVVGGSRGRAWVHAMSLLLAATLARHVLGLTPSATIYVSQCFEVREHDAPTKYVFNGQTRVARFTGSLSASNRLQRLRVYSGWNLGSAAINANNVSQQISEQLAATNLIYTWSTQAQTFSVLGSGATLIQSTCFWLSSAFPAVLVLRGAYTDPPYIVQLSQPTFLGVGGLEPVLLTNAIPGSYSLWYSQPGTRTWLTRLSVGIETRAPLPATLSPGEAIFVAGSVPASAQLVSSAPKICYYHEDHIGSSAATSDSLSDVVEESATYPFGRLRTSVLYGPARSPYQFTQKELDSESALYNFEARYLSPLLARFSRVDPIPRSNLENPQFANTYSYCANRPVFHTDPSGREPQNELPHKDPPLDTPGPDANNKPPSEPEIPDELRAESVLNRQQWFERALQLVQTWASQNPFPFEPADENHHNSNYDRAKKVADMNLPYSQKKYEPLDGGRMRTDCSGVTGFVLGVGNVGGSDNFYNGGIGIKGFVPTDKPVEGGYGVVPGKHVTPFVTAPDGTLMSMGMSTANGIHMAKLENALKSLKSQGEVHYFAPAPSAAPSQH